MPIGAWGSLGFAERLADPIFNLKYKQKKTNKLMELKK